MRFPGIARSGVVFGCSACLLAGMCAGATDGQELPCGFTPPAHDGPRLVYRMFFLPVARAASKHLLPRC